MNRYFADTFYCISFVVMEEFELTEALTGDRHFEQAGFVARLK